MEVAYGGQAWREAHDSGPIRAGETRRFLFTVPVDWADEDRRCDYLMPDAQIRAVDRDTGVEDVYRVPFV